jgi:hypothetical protein
MQVAKNKYAVLDSAIMKILGKEPVPFSLIMLPDVAGECSRLADEERISRCHSAFLTGGYRR